MANSLSLLRLLQLCSSNLPVGGYTFSQGMEYAIEAQSLKSKADVEEWVISYATATLKYSDLPLLKRSMKAILAEDAAALVQANAMALALRETKELLLADTAMGKALLKLLIDTDVKVPEGLSEFHRASGSYFKHDVSEFSHGYRSISFVTAFAVAACGAYISYQEAASGYAWTIVENQILAAAKLLPMGQTDCQAMLQKLSPQLAELVDDSHQVKEEELGLSLPGLAMASAKHESQYSRLYRS